MYAMFQRDHKAVAFSETLFVLQAEVFRKDGNCKDGTDYKKGVVVTMCMR